jgi:hypothetical protein
MQSFIANLIIIAPLKKIVTVPILEILNSVPSYLLSFVLLESLQNHNYVRSKRLFLLDAYALIFRGYYAFIKIQGSILKEWTLRPSWAS